ncbi:hypothetical protein HYU22_03865 [Candidatus Woesearchaeota archaeon]|nr:hypothetical protein [Candidatus Woesearchaeota archaeon]
MASLPNTKITSSVSVLRHLETLKQARWLLPGWLAYEFYNVHKHKGYTHKESLRYGAKAEAFRLAAMTFPLPGTYELTTTGLAMIKKKIEQGEVETLTLQAFKDFLPLKVLNKVSQGQKFSVDIYQHGKKLLFKVSPSTERRKSFLLRQRIQKKK